MKPRAADLRRQAWNSLAGKWGLAIGTFIIASLLGATEGFSLDISSFFNTSSSSDVTINMSTKDISSLSEFFELYANELKLIAGVLITTAIFSAIVGLIMFFIGSIVGVGYSKFNLNIIDLKKADLPQIFSYFKHWSTAILTALLKTLYIFLWSLLFVIPGIIAAYRYSMTSFILSENPSLSPDEAVAESKRIMQGNKWRLFCLNLSFIGWDILSVLTLGILSFWVGPYKNAATAAFYRSIVPAPLEVNDEFGFDQTEFNQTEFDS